MQEYLKFILLGMLVVFAISLIAFMYQNWSVKVEDERITQAKVETQVNDIYWYSTAYKVAFAAILVVCLVSILLLSYSIARSRLKKAAVHTYKIGKHNEVVVHEKDLSIAAPIAMGLMNAEQLKQMNGGVERAFELYTRMAEVQTKQIQALVGRKGVTPSASPAAPAGQFSDQPALAGQPNDERPVPTFQELLASREIARGAPMILGYEHGMARRGSFLDIYSAAVAGESGSGKTATLLFLIGSGLVACGVRFIGIDPHYPHPKSLGFKTKVLWENGLMRMATYKDDMLGVLNEIERTIDARLKQHDTDTTPVVLVIDELAFLSKTSIGGAIAHTMERISTEGRKCDVYMLASSQTWLAARTGDSSAVRDTLTSAYVHRIKPKQANLLLQDKEEAEKVKKYIKQAGDVLFCPVNDESTVCRMPFATEEDMQLVADMLKDEEGVFTVQTVHARSAAPLPEQAGPEELPKSASEGADALPPKKPTISAMFDARLLTPDILRERMQASPLGEEHWRRQLSEASGVSEGLIQGVVDGKRKLTTRTAKKLAPYLSEDV
jgi:plasmid maintenance system antidote protein VapI